MARHARKIFATLLLAAASAGAAGTDAAYGVQFRLEIEANQPVAQATIRVIQSDDHLRRLRMRFPAGTFSDVAASGKLERDGDVIDWHLPARGGEIRYRVQISHARASGAYDALVTDRWGIFRADDVFPPAQVTQRAGARGRSEFLIDLPRGWRAMTPYLPDGQGRLTVYNPDRSFARPVGWVAVGQIGSRKDMIGPTLVAIAAPKGQGVQRVPMLALLRWTLPVLQAELESPPSYLFIVAADEPMWRGGLSAPNSLFIHASRPLLSENGTSTLVHELLHVLAPVPAAAEHDWIDEGLPEYLGLVLLERSGTISRERFEHAIATFRQRGARVRSMRTAHASGEVTARAVAIFHDLDRELQQRSGGHTDLFDLVRDLMKEPEPVDMQRLRILAAGVVGGAPLQSLSASRVPGMK